MNIREALESAIKIAKRNGYSVSTREKPGFIGVRVVSPTGRSDYEYDFFADSDSSVLNETLNDMINWVSVTG